MSKVHAEISYRKNDGTSVHSDICPQNHDAGMINNKEYKEFLHECLNEWLNNSNGSGGFYIKEEGYIF